MADSKLTALTALTPILTTDILYCVSDPGGTPVSKKVAVSVVKTAIIGAGSVSVASGKTLTVSNILTLAGTDSTVMTFPATSATIARTDAAQTFTGTQAFGAITASGVITQTSASATAFETGPNGGTNPVLRIVNSTASQADGVSITGLAAGSGTTFTGLSSGSNAGFTFTPKGTGGFTLTTGIATFGGVVRAAGGSSSTPSFSLASDVSTGLDLAAGSMVLYGTGVALANLANGRLRVGAATLIGFSSTGDANAAAADTAFARNAAGVAEVNNGTAGAGGALLVRGAGATHAEALTINSTSELLVLSTSGATSDTSANLLPANAIILSVTARITVSIAGVNSTALQIGDATTAARFGSGATLTANATIVGLSHLQGGVATDAAGPVQTAAAKVRLTLAGGGDNTPSAGTVRITVHYLDISAATS